MRWQDTRFRPVWLVAAFCLGVLLTGSNAFASDDVLGAGELIRGVDQSGRGSADSDDGIPDGLDADPDTFQIDSRLGGSIGEIRSATPEVPRSDGFLSWVRMWLTVVFSGGFLRGWLQ